MVAQSSKRSERLFPRSRANCRSTAHVPRKRHWAFSSKHEAFDVPASPTEFSSDDGLTSVRSSLVSWHWRAATARKPLNLPRQGPHEHERHASSSRIIFDGTSRWWRALVGAIATDQTCLPSPCVCGAGWCGMTSKQSAREPSSGLVERAPGIGHQSPYRVSLQQRARPRIGGERSPNWTQRDASCTQYA